MKKKAYNNSNIIKDKKNIVIKLLNYNSKPNFTSKYIIGFWTEKWKNLLRLIYPVILLHTNTYLNA